MTEMRGVTDGLYLGEVVLLVLGVVLFLVLVFAFVYQLLRQRSLKPLLLFFLVPVLMIGYPTIKSVQYKDGALTLDKLTRELAENPTDDKLREALDKKVKDVAPRVANSPKDAVKLAQAQFDLGREDEAARSLERVPASNGSLPEVRELRKRLDQVDRLRSLAGKVEANPGDQQSRAELQRNLAAADQVKWVNPNALAAVSKAHSAVGEHAKAKASIDKAIRIAPNTPKFQRQRDSLVRDLPP
jgi:tetratricopeptide (TPR) repeat protein